VDHVGLDQNFFDLGAHSLMVAEVHIQLQQALGREISLVDLFQFPTVGALASHMGGVDDMPGTMNRAERRLAARKQRGQ
jgi:acyl carrier protein